MIYLQDKLGYRFKNPRLLDEALTHKSYSEEHSRCGDNERLEFLGDSVLGLVVSGYIFAAYPDKDEGFLSKLRAGIVSREEMSVWAADLRLGDYLRFGVGEVMRGGKNQLNNLANAMEAVLGAVYIDGGLEAVKKIILPRLSGISAGEIKPDFKSRLQEIIQKKFNTVPSYETLEESGPEHDKKFTVRVYVGKQTLGIGTGKNLKTSQRSAAEAGMDYLKTHKLRSSDLK